MSVQNLPPTASISDALDRLGLAGSLHGIGALAPGQRIAGSIFTVRYEPVDAAGGTVGDFLDDVHSGAVVVIDNDGRTDCTVWGGIMTQLASSQGVAGTVINGVCRDTAIARELDYPIWSAGRFMRTGKDRVRLAAVGGKLTIDGVTIRSGDVLVGDDDGVVVLAAERADEVIELARVIDAAEDAIVAAVRGGMSLKDARVANGYHSLQTRSSS